MSDTILKHLTIIIASKILVDLAWQSNFKAKNRKCVYQSIKLARYAKQKSK